MVLVPFAVSCSKEQVTIVLSEEGFETAYSNLFSSCVLSWPAAQNASVYKVKVYAMGNEDTPLYETKISAQESATIIKCELPYDVVTWQYLDVYITAYNSDCSVSSNQIKKSIICSVEEEDIYIAEEQEAGIVDGVDSVDYYFAMWAENINIVKETDDKDYAILVDDAENVSSLTLPFGIQSGYLIDTELGAVIIAKSIINAYTTGSVIPMTLNYSNGDRKDFIVSLVPALTPTIAPVVYKRASGNDVTINCLKTKSQWAYEEVLIDDEKVEFNITLTKAIKLKAKVLSGLSVGEHSLKVYYSYNSRNVGYSETTITIDKGSFAPYNVQVEFDDTYPSVRVTWDVDYPYESVAIYKGTSYISLETTPTAFNGNSFTTSSFISKAADVIKVKVTYADGSVFSSADAHLAYDLPLSDKSSYFDNTTTYLGEVCNHYIRDEEDLFNFVSYSINHFPDSDTIRNTECSIVEQYVIYSPYLKDNYGSVKNLKSIVEKQFQRFIEPMSYDIEIIEESENSDIIGYKVALRSGSTRPYNSFMDYTTTRKYTEYPYSELHYYTNSESTRSSTFDDFKYKQTHTKEAQVTTSLELALALEQGLLPVPVKNSNAELILNEAKSVLREIIDDRMTDYEKVLAIYDWLSYNVIYDRGLTSLTSTLSKISSQYRALYKNASFYAEGVFLYGVAVCNGIGSAFSIMANIEGIPAIKTMGSVSSGSHTWVKVCVNDEWYVCDATWSSAADTISGSSYYEFITYDFFMMSEPEANSYKSRKEFTDKPSYKLYAGNTTYDYYASQAYVEDGNIYTKYIYDTADFEVLINHYIKQVQSGQTIQFSVEGQPLNTSTSSSARIFYKWLTELYYPNHTDVANNYKITIMERTSEGLQDVSNPKILPIYNFNTAAYIRIEAL